MKNYRHGDMALVEIKALPSGLKKSNSKILMTGSGGHDHTYDYGEFYPHQDGLVIGYLVAKKNTKLFHPEHGKVVKGTDLREAAIPTGVYELRKQHEETNDGIRPVQD